MSQELILNKITQGNPIQFWEGYSSYKDISINAIIDEDSSKGKFQTKVSDYMDEKIKVGLSGMLYTDRTEQRVDSLISKVGDYQQQIESFSTKTESLLQTQHGLEKMLNSHQLEIDKLMTDIKEDYDIISKNPKTEPSVLAKIQQEIKENQAKVDSLVLKKEAVEQKAEQVTREISILQSQSLEMQANLNSDIQTMGQEILGMRLEQERFDRILGFDFQQETQNLLTSRNLTLNDFITHEQSDFVSSILARERAAASQLSTSQTLDIDDNILAIISPTLINVATQVMNSKISELEVGAKRYLDLGNGNMSDAFHIFFQRNYDDVIQNKISLDYVKETINDAKSGLKNFWDEEKSIYSSSSSVKMKVASILTESKLGQASVLALTVGLSSYALASALPVMAAAAVVYGAVRPLMKSIQHFANSQVRITKGSMGVAGYEKELNQYRSFIKLKVDPSTAHNTDPSQIKLMTEYNSFERNMYNLGVFYASLKHNFQELLEPLKNLKEGFVKLKNIFGNLIEYSNQKKKDYASTDLIKVNMKEHNQKVVAYVNSRLNEVPFDKANVSSTIEHIAYLINKGNQKYLGLHTNPTEIMELTQINNLVRSNEFREIVKQNGLEVSYINSISRNMRLKLVGLKESVVESPFVLKANKI